MNYEKILESLGARPVKSDPSWVSLKRITCAMYTNEPLDPDDTILLTAERMAELDELGPCSCHLHPPCSLCVSLTEEECEALNRGEAFVLAEEVAA